MPNLFLINGLGFFMECVPLSVWGIVGIPLQGCRLANHPGRRDSSFELPAFVLALLRRLFALSAVGAFA